MAKTTKKPTTARKTVKDNNWVKPPNIIAKKGPDNVPHKLSYWIDKNGKYQLYTKEQLATCNILTNLNLIIVKSLVLMDTLKKMDENAKIRTLIKQDYSKFDAKESSIFNHFITLMAAVPDITFGEFLEFLSGDTDSQVLNKMGKKTLKEAMQGKGETVTTFYTSDLTKKQ